MPAPPSPIGMTTFLPEQQPQQSFAGNLPLRSAIGGMNTDLERGDDRSHFHPNPLASASTVNKLLQIFWPAQLPSQSSQGPYTTNTFNSRSLPDGLSDADHDARKYRGYPAMSTWMASDDDFFVIRRFSQLSARVVLFMQNRIVGLERIVQEEDAKCLEATGIPESENGSFDMDFSTRRQKAMDELVWRLEHYQRFVLDHSKLKARPDATKRQVSNVEKWLYNANDPIRPDEVAFIKKEGDLMPMVPRVKPPLRRFLDRFGIIGRISCFRRKGNKLDQRHFQSETTIYNLEERIDKAVTCVTIVLGVVMLIAPLWILQYIYGEQADMKARLEIITGFLIGFTALLSIVTVARPFEVLAATAAYGAVLMVFMQLGDSGGAQGGR